MTNHDLVRRKPLEIFGDICIFIKGKLDIKKMDIQTSKLELVKLIAGIENPKIIDKVLRILKSEQVDFWLELTPQEKEEVQIGIRQLDAGQRISLDDFLKKVS